MTNLDYKKVTCTEALELLKRENFILLDIREEQELEAVSFDTNNKIHMPMIQIMDHHTKLPKNKNIIVGCRSGGRSRKGSMLLKMLGFEHIYNLEGGIIEWCKKGLPHHGDASLLS